jgi:hypothetical protein
MWDIEYQNDYILIMSDCESEVFIIIEKYKLNHTKIFTWFHGLDNEVIENAIREVLSNGSYDIEEEIENYRTSRLWHDLEEYNKE